MHHRVPPPPPIRGPKVCILSNNRPVITNSKIAVMCPRNQCSLQNIESDNSAAISSRTPVKPLTDATVTVNGVGPEANEEWKPRDPEEKNVYNTTNRRPPACLPRQVTTNANAKALPPLPQRPPAVPRRKTINAEVLANENHPTENEKKINANPKPQVHPEVKPEKKLPATSKQLPETPDPQQVVTENSSPEQRTEPNENVVKVGKTVGNLKKNQNVLVTSQKTQSVTFQNHSGFNSKDTVSNFYFASTRINCTKPPPLPPVVIGGNNLQKNFDNSNKKTIRQDSSISNDSFSQNSSPSYTTKTMEAPLLPNNQENLSFGYYKKKGSNRAILNKKNKEKIKIEDINANDSPITKSVSTPAGLQTIIKFHNGSNMSLHHRIMRDMARPSGHFGSGIKIKFRFAQVLVNAIALLAISGGLAIYLKAYPASIQPKNETIVIEPASLQNIYNPAPGICLPVIVNFCLLHKIPYNFTVFPNYMGHFSQRDAQQELEVYDAVVDVRCYELAPLFLCSVFVPKCGQNGQVVRPCRSLCFETKRRCGFFLDVFGLSLPDYLECGLFPESQDPDVCVGHKEVIEVKVKSQKPTCTSGFQCDVKRCIPVDWQCDGHVDCKDQSDELNCKQCAKGMLHCGEEHCMAQEHMCDGQVDCPWGQDERNCLRLSEWNGDEGHGQLEVFLPEQQQWAPACVTHWDPSTSADQICTMLGYASSNWSRYPVKYTDADISPPYNDVSPLWRSYKGKMNLVREFRSCAGNSHSTVNLTCTDYMCGKIRKIRKQRNKRIVGGVESSPGDWPFLAALLGGPEEIFYCAGVLITDQWVLTASHCVGNHSDISGWTIQLGLTRRHSHSYYGQKMKVRRVVPHPMYNLEVAHDNDVALFQLASRVTFHEYLRPACLPPSNRELKPGTICTVVGWGKREDKGMSEYEPAVNEVQVPVVNRNLCNAWLKHRDLNVTDGMICAGYPEGGKDACQGDSGGPLLCRDDDDPDRWYVGGIVSWGIKCAHPHLPGVYAYVPRFVSWINQQIAQFSY